MYVNMYIYIYIWGGTQKTGIYKKLCIYPYMFKLQSPSNYSPFDTIHLSRCFFHCSKPFLNSLILLPLSASAVFVSTLPHRQNVSLWELISSSKTKKGHSEQDQVNREGGAWGSCCFLVKNCWTLSSVWAGVLVNHPSWNGKMRWNSLQKPIHWAECSLPQRQLEHSYRWVPRTLTYSGGSLYYKGPTLQKIILVFLDTPPPHILYIIIFRMWKI